MKVAIVDDNKTEAKTLKEIIICWSQAECLQLQCDCYYGGEQFLNGVDKISSSGQEHYSIVFMDIYMNGIDGIQTASELRKISRDSLIIFLTSSRIHMPHAFSVHAFDYLVKPIDEQSVSRVLSEALPTLPEKKRYLILPMGRQSIPVLYDEILYATSDANYSFVIAGDEYHCRMPFRKIEAALCSDDRFLTINRGLLVNLDYVVEMEGLTCQMKNGKSFPLNTKKEAALKQRLINHRFTRRLESITAGGED